MDSGSWEGSAVGQRSQRMWPVIKKFYSSRFFPFTSALSVHVLAVPMKLAQPNTLQCLVPVHSYYAVTPQTTVTRNVSNVGSYLQVDLNWRVKFIFGNNHRPMHVVYVLKTTAVTQSCKNNRTKNILPRIWKGEKSVSGKGSWGLATHHTHKHTCSALLQDSSHVSTYRRRNRSSSLSRGWK